MITVYPYEQLGGANHGWLNAKHHFSFASYHNLERMGFGALRVINDDTIAAGTGFDTHPHQNMEIITYVRSGAITHRDSEGNVGRTEAGDVQVMSAGTGIYHSEHNLESVDTTLYQIWILPNQQGVKPRWQTQHFPKKNNPQGLSLLVSGDGKAPMFIYQDAYIYAGTLVKGQQINHQLHHQAYVLVSEGEVVIEGKKLKKGDGAEVSQTAMMSLLAQDDSEVIVIDVPKRP